MENRDTKLGGFPPIFLITAEFKKEQKIKRDREYSEIVKAVSIKDIMKAKSEKPLFELN